MIIRSFQRLVLSGLVAQAALLVAVDAGAQGPPMFSLSPAREDSGQPCKGSGSCRTWDEWVQRGDCLRQKGSNQEAINAYYSALVLLPEGSQSIYIGMALSYENAKRYKEELASVQKAMAIGPLTADLWYHQGIAQEGLGQFDEALKSFKKVLEMRPGDANAVRNIGFIYDQTGHPQANQMTKEAIRLNPNDAKAHYNLGAQYAERCESTPFSADCPKAIGEMREALRINPDFPEAWYGLGTLLMNTSKGKNEAIEAFKKAIWLRSDYYEAIHNLGVLYFKEKMYQDSQQTCLLWTQKWPQDELAWRLLAESDAYLRWDEQALSAAARASELDPRGGYAHFAMALALEHMNRHQEALNEMENARRLLSPYIFAGLLHDFSHAQ